MFLDEDLPLKGVFSLLLNVPAPHWAAFLDSGEPVVDGLLILEPGTTNLRGTNLGLLE
jgi:hypothetical protein